MGPFPYFELRREERRNDLELEIALVVVAVGAALKHANLVVEPLDQAEAGLTLGVAVGSNARPVAHDHRGEVLVGLGPLPLQALLPAFKKARAQPSVW